MVTKVSGTTGVDQVKDGTLVVADVKAGEAVGFQKMQLFASQATTTGTSIDFTGIPSWVKQITVMFNGVSSNGTSPHIIQAGSGSIQTSGYTSQIGLLFNSTNIANTEFTTGLCTGQSQAAGSTFGSLTISLLGGNTWVMQGVNRVDSQRIAMVAGNVTLAGPLDRIRLTTVNGTDLFDAGSISILVEGYE